MKKDVIKWINLKFWNNSRFVILNVLKFRIEESPSIFLNSYMLLPNRNNNQQHVLIFKKSRLSHVALRAKSQMSRLLRMPIWNSRIQIFILQSFARCLSYFLRWFKLTREYTTLSLIIFITKYVSILKCVPLHT